MDVAFALADRFRCDPFRFLDMPNDELVFLVVALNESDKRRKTP